MKKHQRPSIVGSYITYIFFVLLSGFFAFFYQQTFFYMLVVLELALPFFSYFLTKHCFMALKPSLFVNPQETQKGNTTHLAVSLHNNTRIPLSSVVLTMSLCSFYYDTTEEVSHIMSLRAKSDNPLSFPITLTKYGLYEVCLTKLECFDFLHMFHFEKNCSLKAQIRIFPEISPKESKHEAIYTEGFDEFEESDKKGNVSSNVTDIREYQPGDRLQKIHWKLSEKIDKLMVKENEATSTNEFFLLMELFRPTKAQCVQNPELSQVLDQALEEAAALSAELIEAREIFIFAIYSIAKEDFIMSTIRSKEDFIHALSECFYEPCYDTENLALNIYQKSGLHKGTLLHVTHKGVDDVTA